ncbi:MAG TPA: CoA-binding protein [Longimicrobiales bacterium]|nr:CoA-binding protein [Longimicrobiales bacterium]
METWREKLVEDRAGAQRILRDASRIAVIGMKPESRAEQPAHYVPAYLKEAGYEVVPVPCYYPEVRDMLGIPVCRTLAQVDGPVDLVVVFRRPHDIPPHVDDIIGKRPAAVWFQSGIRNEAAAERLARAGIEVVQDRCTMVEHRMMVARSR